MTGADVREWIPDPGVFEDGICDGSVAGECCSDVCGVKTFALSEEQTFVAVWCLCTFLLL